MDYIADKATRFFLHSGLIDDEQIEWCKYTLQTFLTNSMGFLLLMVIGLLLAPWPQVLFLNLGVAFLRTKAGGLHMPTPTSCFFVSLFFESISLLILPFFSVPALIVLLVVSIGTLFRFAPCNNQAIHCSDHELSLMRRELKWRLIFLVCAIFLLLVLSRPLAYAIGMSTVVVALSVALSKAGFGIR